MIDKGRAGLLCFSVLNRLSLLLCCALAHGQEVLINPEPEVIGRCPVPSVTTIRPGRFVAAGRMDLVVAQDLGRFEPARAPGKPAAARLFRLHFLCPGPDGFQTAWSSEPLLASGASASGLGDNAWTTGDLDSNGLDELLVFSGDAAELLDFKTDTVRVRRLELPGAWVVDAELGDLDGDSLPELLALERSPVSPGTAELLLRVYAPAESAFVPLGPYFAALAGDDINEINLLPAARFEDYRGRFPVVQAGHSEIRPGTYGIAWLPDSSGHALTLNPFPWQQWFSRERVLPAGPLVTFNVGDTLCAYGYFVPGSRPSGPAESFAALSDGEWRLLPLRPEAQTIVAPLCPFEIEGRPGWLSLRDQVFRFYPGQPFCW